MKNLAIKSLVVTGLALLTLAGCVITGNNGRRVYSHHEKTQAYTHNYGATYSSYKNKTHHGKHRNIECFHGSCKS